jgi:predicted P-loop ATPase/GTPase
MSGEVAHFKRVSAGMSTVTMVAWMTALERDVVFIVAPMCRLTRFTLKKWWKASNQFFNLLG